MLPRETAVSRENAVSVDELRTAATDRVRRSSFRLVAQEIGVAHTTLASFIHGAEPYGRTLAKLQAWYRGEANELARLRNEVAELKKRVAELEAQLREARK